MKKRIGWVDIFRAICIIAIVMGHTSAKYGIYTRLFSVAAFFFISGFLTNYNKENFIDFLKNKFKSLMIPFLAINIVFIMLRYFLKFAEIESIFYTDSINFTYFINLFKHFATTDLGGATWFLPTLFFTNIIYKLLYDLITKEDIKKKIYLFCISIGICIWGYWQYYNMQQYLSYSIDLIYMALIFVASGSLYKEMNKKYEKNIVINLIITIVSIICAIYILKNNDKGINWPTRDFPNILFMMISSFSFIWIFIQLSKIIEKIRYLSNVFIYVGKNSLPIFLYHFISFRMLFCIFYKLNLVSKEQLYNLTPIYNNDLLFIITIITGVAIPLIIDLIINYFKKCVHFKNSKLILYYSKKIFERKYNKNIKK